MADLGLGATALPANVLAQATSGLPNPRLAMDAAREAEELLGKAKNGGRDFWSGPGEAGAAGNEVPLKKTKHEGSSPSSALPKLERSQLLTLPPHATSGAPAVAGVAAGVPLGGAVPAAGASPPTAAQAGALLSLAEPSAAVNVSSPIASATTAPMGTGPALPPLPLNNLNRHIADTTWLTHTHQSGLTPREQEFTDFLSGMLSNRGGAPTIASPGRVSTIDILRVRSNSQVGEIELIQAQASVQQQAQQQGQGLQVRSRIAHVTNRVSSADHTCAANTAKLYYFPCAGWLWHRRRRLATAGPAAAAAGQLLAPIQRKRAAQSPRAGGAAWKPRKRVATD